MSDIAPPPAVCVLAERRLGFEPPEIGRLRRLRRGFTLLKSRATLSEKHAALKGCDVLIAIRPTSGDARLWLQAASGMGLNLLVLTGRGPQPPLPVGAQSFTQLEALLATLAGLTVGGPPGRYVSPDLVRSFNPCQESVDFFENRYPQGGHSRDWTRDEQVSLLKEGGARWLRSMFDRGVVRQWPMIGVNFAGAELSQLRLADAELRGADLTGANLAGCQLRKTDLGGAKLARATMIGSVLHDCDATEAVFAGADLSHSHLRGVTLDGADLRGADLTGSHIRQGPARRARFGGAQLAGATLKSCDLSGADLASAQMRGCRLVGCQLAGVRFGGEGPESEGLDGAAFIDCEMDADQVAAVTAAGGHVARIPRPWAPDAA